jgi:DNA-binding NarL/FixJ family response regulator
MRIVIADDHAMTRSGVIAALSEMYSNAEIIECDDAASVLLAAKNQNLNLAIVDLFMPGYDGFVFLKKLCNLYPGLPVAVLSASDNPKHVQKAIDLGVSGFIHKSSGFDDMHAALKKVLSGGIYRPETPAPSLSRDMELSADLDQPQNREALIEGLSKRQLEILACLAKGMSNKDIAHTLFISANTVKTHLKSLMLILECNNRTEAGVLAEKLGLPSS